METAAHVPTLGLQGLKAPPSTRTDDSNANDMIKRSLIVKIIQVVTELGLMVWIRP